MHTRMNRMAYASSARGETVGCLEERVALRNVLAFFGGDVIGWEEEAQSRLLSSVIECAE